MLLDWILLGQVLLERIFFVFPKALENFNMYIRNVSELAFFSWWFWNFIPSFPFSSLHLSLLLETNESRDFKVILNANYTTKNNMKCSGIYKAAYFSSQIFIKILYSLPNIVLNWMPNMQVLPMSWMKAEWGKDVTMFLPLFSHGNWKFFII